MHFFSCSHVRLLTSTASLQLLPQLAEYCAVLVFSKRVIDFECAHGVRGRSIEGMFVAVVGQVHWFFAWWYEVGSLDRLPYRHSEFEYASD